MVALIPSFLLAAQNAYYGPGLSIITSNIAVLLFIAAIAVQLISNKKKGLPITGPLISIAGFTFLLIYINMFMFSQ